MGKVIKHLAQCRTHSRPSMNDPGSRMVWQPWSEIQSDPHVEAIFHVHCVYTSRFLPIPFLFWNGENSSFSSDFRGLFWAWQRRETHRWSPEQLKTGGVPDKNRKSRHLEVFLAAAGASAKYPWVSCQEPPLSTVGLCSHRNTWDYRRRGFLQAPVLNRMLQTHRVASWEPHFLCCVSTPGP